MICFILFYFKNNFEEMCFCNVVIIKFIYFWHSNRHSPSECILYIDI